VIIRDFFPLKETFAKKIRLQKKNLWWMEIDKRDFELLCEELNQYKVK
jgi:hypothetical protein